MPRLLPRLRAHRVLTGSAVLVVVGALLAWWLVPWGTPGPHGTVVISTGARNGVYERYGEMLESALHREAPGLRITMDTSAGSEENVGRVATGKADFTLAASDAVEQYRLDHKPGWQRLRGCARLYDDYVQLVVPRLSDIRSLKDLRGKRVALGEPGSGVLLIAQRVLKAAGIDPAKDIRARRIGIDAMPQELKEGKIDAFFWSGGLPTRSVLDLTEDPKTPVRFVPLASVVDTLHDEGGASAYYRSSDIPFDAYPSAQQGVPVPTLAVANLLVTTDRVDTDVVERVTRTVIDSRDRIGRQVHAAQHVDLRTALYTDPLVLQKGARDYYRSVKP
jgi:TRAP transporter TAXI family solute receptor